MSHMHASGRASGSLVRLLAGIVGMLVVAGCAMKGSVTGGEGPTASAAQSETAATTSFASNKHRIVVGFNDETGSSGTIIYGPTSRKVLSGASLMGWAYSEDEGAHWTYAGRLSPPSGWSVLWGDPALTTSRTSYRVVLMSNLAVPAAKMPSGGIDGLLYNQVTGESPLGGACIARSTDGGISFVMHQCLGNKQVLAMPGSDKGHFYDGASMAALSSGPVFTAYVDIYTSQIDVWRALTDGGTFDMLPPPFPGLIVQSHPRLRTAPLDDTLYVAALIRVDPFTSKVFMNRFRNGRWDTPVPVSDAAVGYPAIDFGTNVLGSPLTIRTGPQFSFDVGAESEDGNDGIRLLYTRQDGETKRYFIDAVACRKDLTACHAVPGWRAGPGRANETPIDRFNPNVAAWIGFIGLPPSWQGSYIYRYGLPATKVNVARLSLGYVNGTAFTIPVDIIRDAPVCTDTRGYWADYDDHLHVGFSGTTARFTRFLTDSSKGCVTRAAFYATHQHVQSVTYP